MLSRGIISTWGGHCFPSSTPAVGLVSSRVLQQQVCHKLSWQGCGHNNGHYISQSAAPRGFAVAAEPASTGGARSSRTSSDLPDSSTIAGSAAAAGQAPPTARRRRRKLFNSVGDSGPEEYDSGLQATGSVVQPAATWPQPTIGKQHLQQQNQQGSDPPPPQQQQQRAEEYAGWWLHPSAASQLSLYVFWDLDNLKPTHWDQAADLVESLRSVLQRYGVMRQLKAYANSRTLVSVVGMAGLEEQMEEEEEELRCPICGRRCRSLEDLQKHFRQLHEREHQKKLRGQRKGSSKYSNSDKANRVGDAARLYGTPLKNRSGRRGQMVKVLLERAGVRCIEVGTQKQAADDAINRHLADLMARLKAAQPQQPSRAAGQGAAAVDEQDEVQAYMASLPSADACLQDMLTMSEGELRVAWQYLKKVAGKQQRPAWSKLWTALNQARWKRAAAAAPAAPVWLSDAWQSHHSERQEMVGTREQESEQQQQQQRQDAVMRGQRTPAEAQAPPWGTESALQQSVLVIVSDDRGFASSVASWLRRGAAGAVLVTTRGRQGWERPLSDAVGATGQGSSSLQDVVCASWDDIVDELAYEDSDSAYEDYGFGDIDGSGSLLDDGDFEYWLGVGAGQ